MIVISIRCASMTVSIAMAHWSALIAEASGRHQQFQHSIICIWSFKPIRPILDLVLKLHTRSSMQVRSNDQKCIFQVKKITNSNFRLWRCHKESESDNFTTTKRERLCTSLELQMDYCRAAWIFNWIKILYFWFGGVFWLSIWLCVDLWRHCH